ncbi:MAG: hypothetical protein HZA54_03730 [Planctomycetes bacterium]|nr:hypothetical protein [Planctomycetota bacterium]
MRSSLGLAVAAVLWSVLVVGCKGGGMPCCGMMHGGHAAPEGAAAPAAAPADASGSGAAQGPGTAAPAAATVPAAAGPEAAPVERQAYYCPMHPQVTADKLGKCSICGMSLTKRGKR